MISRLRTFVKKNLLIRKLVGYHLASSGLFDRFLTEYKLSDTWKKRITDVIACDDNKFIPRKEGAGAVKSGKQMMHNGLKIHLGSYYGPEYVKMLMLNKGVHEPQEEKVFADVLKRIPEGATMIEMGAFWSFYSMWFQQEVPNAKNFMIEPDSFNLGQGKRNFRLNGMKGKFVQAFMGRSSVAGDPVPTLCIDDLVKSENIEMIDLLHSDIQGFEYEMLEGASKTITEGKVGFIFISTHSPEVHQQCLDFLNDHGFHIVSEADLDNTYSEDGLIVGVNPNYDNMKTVAVAQKNTKPEMTVCA